MPLSEYHKNRRIYMLAKLLILGEKEPASEVTMTQLNLEQHQYGKRRVGRPRLHWLNETLRDMWEVAKRDAGAPTHETLDTTKTNHKEYLHEVAMRINEKHKFLET